MPATTADTMRLAPVEQPGSTLYNSYHFLTQVSGLYAQAATCEPDPLAAATWNELCDLSIRDLGELVHAWEAALGDARGKPGSVVDPKVGPAVARMCRRLNALSNGMNVWTPMARWARILHLCESRWLRFVSIFTNISPSAAAKLATIKEGAQDRGSRLKGLIERYRQDEERARVGFALVSEDDVFKRKTGT